MRWNPYREESEPCWIERARLRSKQIRCATRKRAPECAFPVIDWSWGTCTLQWINQHLLIRPLQQLCKSFSKIVEPLTVYPLCKIYTASHIHQGYSPFGYIQLFLLLLISISSKLYTPAQGDHSYHKIASYVEMSMRPSKKESQRAEARVYPQLKKIYLINNMPWGMANIASPLSVNFTTSSSKEITSKNVIPTPWLLSQASNTYRVPKGPSFLSLWSRVRGGSRGAPTCSWAMLGRHDAHASIDGDLGQDS